MFRFACRADHVGAAGFRDLDCEVSDSAGRRVDQDALVLLEVGGADEGLPGGQPRERNRGRT